LPVRSDVSDIRNREFGIEQACIGVTEIDDKRLGLESRFRRTLLQDNRRRY